MGAIGIDLGTNNVLLCDKKKGIFLRQPSVVVIDRESDGVIAVGRSAQEILERTPSGIYAAKPIHEGKIFDPEIGSTLLRALLKPYNLHRIAKPDFIFTVPSNISQLEERALIEIGQSAGARRVYLVESVLASAIGAKMDFYKPEGRAIVDIGAGVCNIGRT